MSSQFRHWESVLKIADSFEITANHTLTTLATLPKEWMVEFMIKPTSLNFKAMSTQSCNILHMTRPQRPIETIASFDQWSGTIENH